MSGNPRIEELRRRVASDPASIAFAQLAEEHRREGDFEEAIQVCRTGLAQYPAYLSARVTLGRALAELGQFDEAKAELEYVLKTAPDNLAANRALAELHQRRGQARQAPDLPATPPPIPESDDVGRLSRSEASEDSSNEVDEQFARVLESLDAATPASPFSSIEATESPVESVASDAPAVSPQADPTLQRLEAWLDAILEDRKARERSDAAS